MVIVGIDEDATKALKEPFALWHPHLSKFLDAMTRAKPSVVGLDIALPDRSYQFLAPQYDQSLLRGLQELKAQTPLVMAQPLDDSGAFRPVYAPYVSAVGANSLASVAVCQDEDGVVRRFDPNLCTVNAQGSMLVEKMAAHLGKAKPGTGLVDFSAGDKFEYVPFLKVLEWQARGDTDELTRTFGGKPVLLGVVSRFGDRVEGASSLGSVGSVQTACSRRVDAGADIALHPERRIDPRSEPACSGCTDRARRLVLAGARRLDQVCRPDCIPSFDVSACHLAIGSRHVSADRRDIALRPVRLYCTLAI